jgi:hypothetical protein
VRWSRLTHASVGAGWPPVMSDTRSHPRRLILDGGR